MFAKFREFINSIDQKKKTNLLLVGLLIGALGLTVITTQQQTRSRQQAAETAEDVTLTLSPTSATVPVGQPLSVDILLKAGSRNITGADIIVNFNNAIFSITQFTPSGQFNSEVTKTIDANAGTFHYVVANTDLSKQITGDITLGTLALQPRVAGQAEVNLLASQIVASDATESLSVATENGSYTIEGQPSPSPTLPQPTTVPTVTPLPPTPTATPKPTATPIPPTATNTPIPPTPTKVSVLGDANGDSVVDILDYNIWRDEFSGRLTTKTSDFNNDGKIDLLDFNIWRNAFGATNPTSAPTAPVVGFGKAVKVSAAGQYIDIPSNLNLVTNNRFTIEVWFKPDYPTTTSSGGSILSKKAVDGREVKNVFGLTAGYRKFSPNDSNSDVNAVYTFSYAAKAYSCGGSASYSGTEKKTDLGKWKHIAGVINGQTIYLFVNGKLLHSNTDPKLSDGFCTSDLPLLIGSGFTTGEIDEVRLSSSARYLSSFSLPIVPFKPEATTVALWHLDGDAKDNSGSGVNSGRLVGNIQFVTSTIPIQ